MHGPGADVMKQQPAHEQLVSKTRDHDELLMLFQRTIKKKLKRIMTNDDEISKTQDTISEEDSVSDEDEESPHDEVRRINDRAKINSMFNTRSDFHNVGSSTSMSATIKSPGELKSPRSPRRKATHSSVKMSLQEMIKIKQNVMTMGKVQEVKRAEMEKKMRPPPDISLVTGGPSLIESPKKAPQKNQ